MTALSMFELNILDFFQTLQNPVCDAIASLLSVIAANGEVFILLTLLMLLYKPTRRAGLVCTTALILDFLILNVTIKPLVARIRPYDLNPAVQLIVRAPHDFSFPSGHTGVSFAFAFALKYLGKKPHRAAVIFAVVMGLSRLYLYVHYPTDVLAGALVGAICGLMSVFVWKKASKSDAKCGKIE